MSLRGEDILKAMKQMMADDIARGRRGGRANAHAYAQSLHAQYRAQARARPPYADYRDDPRTILGFGRYGEPIYVIECVVVATEIHPLTPPTRK